MLPPVFMNKYPELRDPTGHVLVADGVAEKRKNEYHGLDSDVRGEDCEFAFFKCIDKMALAHKNMIVLQSFEILRSKCMSVIKLYPSVQQRMQKFIDDQQACRCTGVCRCIFGEHDFVILVQGKGVILVEIKSAARKKDEGIKQLNRMHEIVNIFFNAVLLEAQDASMPEWIDLPVIKVICCPQVETTRKHPDGKHPTTGIWHLHKDAINNFQRHWSDIYQDLRCQQQQYKIDDYFSRFSNLMVGLWAMQSANGLTPYKGNFQFIHSSQCFSY